MPLSCGMTVVPKMPYITIIPSRLKWEQHLQHHKVLLIYVVHRILTDRVSIQQVFIGILICRKNQRSLETKRLEVPLTHWKLKLHLSIVHRYYFNPMSINVREQDFGSSLNYINEFFNALTATLTVPVLLVEKQRLQELFPETLRPQHWHRVIW